MFVLVFGRVEQFLGQSVVFGWGFPATNRPGQTHRVQGTAVHPHNQLWRGTVKGVKRPWLKQKTVAVRVGIVEVGQRPVYIHLLRIANLAHAR